jgi:hypothetical protein
VRFIDLDIDDAFGKAEAIRRYQVALGKAQIKAEADLGGRGFYDFYDGSRFRILAYPEVAEFMKRLFKDDAAIILGYVTIEAEDIPPEMIMFDFKRKASLP